MMIVRNRDDKCGIEEQAGHFRHMTDICENPFGSLLGLS
jgi:hypothetical protein